MYSKEIINTEEGDEKRNELVRIYTTMKERTKGERLK